MGDIKTAFAQMTWIRDEITPEPFVPSPWTKADKAYLHRQYSALGRGISDQATEFLKANGFRPGGLKKLK